MTRIALREYRSFKYITYPPRDHELSRFLWILNAHYEITYKSATLSMIINIKVNRISKNV